ncbi:hypothetical protein [Clostridium sp. B9]|uniref:hypothetical protein n=1 Tax=Clostridium sp. B9 TaxID=3423224 RepID=UPI003D2EFD3A
MKHRKYSKHKKRDMRIYSPTHINSGGVIDYKLPICDFMDNVLSKKPYSISVLTENSDGTKYYYEYDFDGKNIIVSKSLVPTDSPELKLIEKYKGNVIKKEFLNDSIVWSLYKNEEKVADTVSYKSDLNLDADMIIEFGSYFYRLPLCEFMDNILTKTPDKLKIIFFGFEGDMYYITLNFDGEYISYTKYIISNAKLKEIEKYTGNRLVKEFTDGNSIRLNLYDDDSLITTILAYSNKYLPYNL